MHIIKNIIYNVIKDSESEITQTNSNLVNSFLSIAGICSIPFLQSYLKNKSHQAAKDNNDKEEPSFLSSPLTKKISSSLAFSITYYLLSTTNTVGLPDND
jgi:hypothetical protein